MKRLFSALLFLTFGAPEAFSCARGWDINEMSPVLIPVFFEGTVPGGFGSVWDAELRVFTAAWGWEPFGGGGCGVHFPVRAQVEPDTSFEPEPKGQASNPGRLVYLLGPGHKAHEFSHWYNSRIRDLSRRLETAGTELPVIIEDELLTQRTQLLNIPLRSEFRSTLRVYDPDGRGDGQVRLRLYDLESEGAALWEGTLFLFVNKAPSHWNEDPQPGFAQITDLGVLVSAPTQRLRVEIEPLTPGLRYWAFVSVTNNTTQHVTLVTPH